MTEVGLLFGGDNKSSATFISLFRNAFIMLKDYIETS